MLHLKLFVIKRLSKLGSDVEGDPVLIHPNGSGSHRDAQSWPLRNIDK
jgi:hypothetical protein